VTATAQVCVAASCLALHSDAVLGSIRERLEDSPQAAKGVGCLGLCAAGPLVRIRETGRLVERVDPAHVDDVLTALGEADAAAPSGPAPVSAAPFFARQVRVVTENLGDVDPERLDDYVAHGGYEALAATLRRTPAQIIDEVTRSGLRGRGGAGYPTGLKWATVAKASGAPKYIVCNADEGDPGAFMDRSVMESDPHRVLEGMAIAAHAVGASHGYIYCRAEYPLALSRLGTALRQAEDAGHLGRRGRVGSTAFTVELRVGAGAFVCGEETALIASIQGGRGTPRPRPPYPAASGLWGKPTLINNVETFAAVPTIIRRGGDWYATIGSGTSRGTKVFALAGRIVNTGLIEVPLGITLREVVYDIGGGIVGGGAFKAVQTGGASGGCLPEELLDMPIEYETLKEAGSIMGSGGMVVLDETTCIVDVARYFMHFCREESCGKCIPCRVGTTQLSMLLDAIAEGRASRADLAQLEELTDMVQHTSLCGLGQGAPNPVVSTLRWFRDEYLAHIDDRTCPAGVCPVAAASPVA
jgi:bidirectional [NiFe] hydrogenase diaphorase subunit